MNSTLRMRCGTVIVAFAAAAITGCSPAILTVDDGVIFAGRQTRLVAHFQRQLLPGVYQGVSGKEVQFLVEGRVVAQAQTDDLGAAVGTCEFQAVNRFTARTTFGGRSLEAQGTLYTWQSDRTIIAVDIDKTIADTEYEDLYLKSQDRESSPIRGASETLSRLSKDYHLFYLTARPKFVLDKTRDWLSRNHFPPGPVITAPSLKDAIKQTRYKRRTLRNLKQYWPNVLIGIGNNHRDAEAYSINDMLPVIVVSSGQSEIEYRPYAVFFANWEEINKFFAANHDTLSNPERFRHTLAHDPVLLYPIYLRPFAE